MKKRVRRRQTARRSRPPSPAAGFLAELTTLSQALVKSLDINRVLEELLLACMRAMESEQGAAYLTEADGRFTLRAQEGFPAGGRGMLEDFFGQAEWLRAVVDRGEPVVVSRAQAGEARGTEWLTQARLLSLLAVPLILGKDRLGALVFASTRGDLRGREALFDAQVRLQLGQATALARMISLATGSEQRLRDLVQDLDAIVWQADPVRLRFTFVSRRAEAMLGYPVEQWLAEPDFWARHICEADRKRVVAYSRKATQEGRDHELEYCVVAADGRPVWLRDTVRVLRDEHGRVKQLRGLTVDISERRQAERELEERSTYLDSLIRNSPLAVVALDAGHRVRMVNPAFERLFQYSEAEILGTHLDEFIAPKEKSSEAASFTRQVLAGDAVHATTMRRRKDGSLVEVEVHGVPLMVNGELVGVYGIYQDVTERKLVEEALRRSEANYRSLVDNAPYGIFRATPAGRFLAVNRALVEMLGYGSEAELLGANIATDAYRDPAERERLIAEHWQNDRFDWVEVGWKRKNGEPITVRLAGRLVRDASGQVGYAEEIVEDVTERRVLEQQLRQAQKMEAVGRLAGGIAHDFNNLLMVIRGHSELLRLRLAEEHTLRHHAQEIDKAAERAAALTQQLLAFSRKQMVQPRVIDLNSVLVDTEAMLRRLIGEDVELMTRLDPRAGNVKADPGQIEQIILNLCVNARDAMPQGGEMMLETQNAELDSMFVSQHPGARAGRYVMLAVSDTGVGMDAETQAHIFEPFFTTKGRGKGTGLGLATVYGIVKQSEGYIAVYSEVGRGSTFKVYLPRVEEEAEALGPPTETAGAVAQGTETILLVEDEEPLRRLAREYLESKGYHVLEAATGREALEVAARHPGSIHLLMTDVVMPGMSGRELADQMVRQRPETLVLYMSGYTDDAIVHHGMLEAGARFLPKPFTLETLSRCLREVLNSGPLTQANKPAG